MLASSIAVAVLTAAAVMAALATLIWTLHVGQVHADAEVEDQGGVVVPFERRERPPL